MTRKMRGATAAIACALAIGMVAGACTPAGPPERSWKVSPVSITVHDKEDHDPGDEPYIMQLGFRSKLGVKNSSSTSFSSQCYNRKLPKTNAAPNGTTIMIPAGAADINLGQVQNLDVGDLALGTAPFEIIGTMTFVAERDGIFESCAVSDLLKSALGSTVKDALELLIARSPKPPTTEQLIQLIVDNIGNFLQAAASLVGAVIEGLGDPDDIIGIAAQIHLPTTGTLTDLIQTGLAIGGLFAPGLDQGFLPIEGLPETLAIKVSPLRSSKARYRFTTNAYDYSFVNSVTRGASSQPAA